MRHHNANRKFNRGRNQRKALIRSLVRELFVHGKIETTLAKAKESAPYAEDFITKARIDTVASRRDVAKRMANNDIVGKLFSEIAPKYVGRNGGYTRIIKKGPRQTDGALMAIIELV
jgi:large subunit ribosomal protein L17